MADGASTVAVVVTRTGDLTAASSVTYATADGTAVAGSDDQAATGTLAFAAGQAAQSAAIKVPRHTLGGSPTFRLSVSVPPAA